MRSAGRVGTHEPPLLEDGGDELCAHSVARWQPQVRRGWTRGAPAQKKELPSVLRGKKMLLAIPMLEKGLPISVRAYASIVFSARFEQPMLR